MEGTIYSAEEVIVQETPKQKKRLKIDWVVILVFVLGFVGVWGFEYWQAQMKRAPVMVTPIAVDQLTPTPTPLSLKPPSEALTASVSGMVGEVKIEERDADDYTSASTSAMLVDGDKLATGVNGEVGVEFANWLSMTLMPSSEISFSNLLPATFLVEQKSGTVDYMVDPGITPKISVRSGPTLTELTAGSVVTMAMDPRAIGVTVASGSAKLAIVDRANNTQVYNVTENQTATVNLTYQTVRIK